MTVLKVYHVAGLTSSLLQIVIGSCDNLSLLKIEKCFGSLFKSMLFMPTKIVSSILLQIIIATSENFHLS